MAKHPRPPKTEAHDERTPAQRLLDHPKVEAWYEMRKLRSALSADVCERSLARTLGRLGVGPDELERLATKDPDRLERMLTAYAATLKAAGRRDDYISYTFSAVRSYFGKRIVFDRFPALNPTRGETLVRERVPTQDELGRVLERLPIRGRASFLLMAHSGLRPGVLGSYLGERGLELKDLPDLDVEKLEFARIPFVIIVPAALSKTRQLYTTFGTHQLATVLKSYLEDRRARGEKLTPESPVIAAAEARGVAKQDRTEYGKGRRFLTTGAIVIAIRDALRATVPAGVTWRPYVARAYCSTRLLMAEGDGKMTRDLREAILGHNLGVSGRYNLGKPWGTDLLERARAEYERASEYLETNARPKADTKAELLSTLATAIEQATGKRTNGALQGEDLVKALRDALHGASDGAETATEASLPSPTVPAPVLAPKRAGEQRSVDADAVGTYLESGWSFVSPLNSHLAVVRWDGAVP